MSLKPGAETSPYLEAMRPDIEMMRANIDIINAPKTAAQIELDRVFQKIDPEGFARAQEAHAIWADYYRNTLKFILGTDL